MNIKIILKELNLMIQFEIPILNNHKFKYKIKNW
jgi:hypothetical protein